MQKDMMKLHAWLAKQGYGSRRYCENLIREGKVSVNGHKVGRLGERITPGLDDVELSGEAVKEKAPKKAYFVLNKPKFTMSTHRDEDDRQTVFDLPSVKQVHKSLQFVGRLDYESEGMMLLTNDGDLNYKITHPSFHVEKEYLVLTNKKMTKQQMASVVEGIKIDRSKILAKGSIEHLSSERLGKTIGGWYSVKIHEGRKRVIRRMFEMLDLKVVRLVRVAIGPLKLSNHLKPGGIQKLSPRQLDAIKSCVGEN